MRFLNNQSGLFVRRIKPLSLFLGCSLFLATSTLGEDVEIYSATLGTGDAGDINPNLLFIADTSGSMDGYVAVEVTADASNYDPSIDYGGDNNAADDNYIYVYEGNGPESYTGVFITDVQNSCEAIDDQFAASPDYPVYQGQGIQWIPDIVQIQTGDAVTCNETEAEATEEYSGIVGTLSDGWQTIDSWDHTEIFGSNIRVTVDPDGYRIRRRGITFADFGLDGRLQIREALSNGNDAPSSSWATTSCTVDTNRNRSQSCVYDADNIPWQYYNIRFQLRSESFDYDFFGFFFVAGENVSHSTSITYNEGLSTFTDDGGGACTPAPPTFEDREDGEWSPDLQIGDTDEYILECAEDQGVHGRTDASTDRYTAFCGDSELCDAPRYLAGQSGSVDFLTSGAPFRFFVSGNYHDFLNAPLTLPGGETVYEASDSYREGDNDGDGNDFNSGNYCRTNNCAIRSYTLNSFCEDFTDDPEKYLNEVYVPKNAYFTDSVNDPGVVYQCQEKNDIMIAAMTDMVQSLSGVNVGVMKFNTVVSADPDNAGTVSFGVKDVDDYVVPGDDSTATVRSELINHIAGIPDSGGTPLAETLYEAYRYYAGLPEGNNNNALDDESIFGSAYGTTGGSHEGGSVYDTPIDHSCQVNTVVYITDGEPSGDTSLDDDIDDLFPGSCDGNCLDEMAGYMFENDLVDNNAVDGVNNVITYTVGFDIDFPLLAETAAAGGGKYFTANNYNDLISAFQQIVVDIALSEPSVLVAPAVSVNAFNELQHRDEIYYATFKPRSSPRWEGNVKKYRINGEGIVLDNSNPPEAAIDPNTGFFISSAQSYWSNFPDGAFVEVGGYREQLTNSRNVYVDGDSLVGGTASVITALTSSSQLTTLATGADNAAEAAELRDLLLGIDIDDENEDSSTTDASLYAADSLHSRPFVITYRGDANDPIDVLIVTTNRGLIHAVDARDAFGTELWSYAPHDTIDNVKDYRDDTSSVLNHVYGLDGEATIWTIEAADSTPSAFNIETAYMFQGMRRGGRNYFAWDISNGDLENGSAAPISNLWRINGGTGDFTDLGQTWSSMIRTKIRHSCTDAAANSGCTEKDVLVFSGGYDLRYDTENNTPNVNAETVPVLGNSVYVVDALTGDLLWSTGSTNTHDLVLPVYNSVPADPSPIDIDGDGDMDVLFFIDISGKIFRVDFDDSKAVDGTGENAFATGGVVADLREGSVFRRFYNGIDVSVNAPRDNDAFFALSVGSGYRAHPKEEETWANRFYVVIDENVNGPEINDNGTPEDDTDDFVEYRYVRTLDGDGNITSRAIITQSDLHAFTTADPYTRGEDGDHGFFRNLDGVNFEKILQTSVTFNGDILVGSYLPIGDTTEATCGSGQIGSGRVYRFSVETGETQFDTNEEFIELAHEGIPPEPTILLVPDLVVCLGTECYDANRDTNDPEEDPPILDDVAGQAIRTYWREN